MVGKGNDLLITPRGGTVYEVIPYHINYSEFKPEANIARKWSLIGRLFVERTMLCNKDYPTIFSAVLLDKNGGKITGDIRITIVDNHLWRTRGAVLEDELHNADINIFLLNKLVKPALEGYNPKDFIYEEYKIDRTEYLEIHLKSNKKIDINKSKWVLFTHILRNVKN